MKKLILMSLLAVGCSSLLAEINDQTVVAYCNLAGDCATGADGKWSSTDMCKYYNFDICRTGTSCGDILNTEGVPRKRTVEEFTKGQSAQDVGGDITYRVTPWKATPCQVIHHGKIGPKTDENKNYITYKKDAQGNWKLQPTYAICYNSLGKRLFSVPSRSESSDGNTQMGKLLIACALVGSVYFGIGNLGVTISDVISCLSVSRSTALRRLNEMIEAGIIERIGEKKSAHYRKI